MKANILEIPGKVQEEDQTCPTSPPWKLMSSGLKIQRKRGFQGTINWLSPTKVVPQPNPRWRYDLKQLEVRNKMQKQGCYRLKKPPLSLLLRESRQTRILARRNLSNSHVNQPDLLSIKLRRTWFLLMDHKFHWRNRDPQSRNFTLNTKIVRTLRNCLRTKEMRQSLKEVLRTVD